MLKFRCQIPMTSCIYIYTHHISKKKKKKQIDCIYTTIPILFTYTSYNNNIINYYYY